MMDVELWAAARQVELAQEAARVQLITRARRLARGRRRGRGSRHDGSAPLGRHENPSLGARGSWAHLT